MLTSINHQRQPDPADQDRRHHWGGQGVPLDHDLTALNPHHIQIKIISALQSWIKFDTINDVKPFYN